MLLWKGRECCSHPNSQGVPGSSVLFSLWLTCLGQQASGEAARMLTHRLAGCRQAHQEERPRPQGETPSLGPWLSDRAWCPRGPSTCVCGCFRDSRPREFAGISRTPGARNLELSPRSPVSLVSAPVATAPQTGFRRCVSKPSLILSQPLNSSTPISPAPYGPRPVSACPTLWVTPRC